MRTDEFKFVMEQYRALQRRMSALEKFVAGEEGADCPQCERKAIYHVQDAKERHDSGWGVLSKELHVMRCALCGYEDSVS